MTLPDALEAGAESLADEAHAAMYADPFWIERFGARGEEFSRHDGRKHVRYLADALRFDKPRILVDYALWLRAVLTTRGMCSRHLSVNLARLADAIERRSFPGAHAARHVVDAARAALRYETGEARAIDDASASIAKAAALASRSLDEEAALHLLSYAADATAQGNDRVFTDHVAWMAAFYERRGVASRDFVALVTALGASGAPPPLRRLVDLALGGAS